VPPGAFPNGSPGTQFTAAPLTAGAIAGAQEIAAQFWQQAEAERQKAREKEAVAALQQCSEEGGCGAEMPGEETFGDPIHCYVGGEILPSEHDKGLINAYGGCSQGLPEGTWIKACIGAIQDEFGPTAKNCNQKIVEHHTSRYWSISIGVGVHCGEGELLWGYVAFYVPGGRTLYAGTIEGRIQGECDAGGGDEVDEFSIGLWPLPDLPPTLGDL
jgi:hypothetical protein